MEGNHAFKGKPVSGVVESVETYKSRGEHPSDLFALVVNGVKYSGFGRPTIPTGLKEEQAIKEGDSISFEFIAKKVGDKEYFNILGHSLAFAPKQEQKTLPEVSALPSESWRRHEEIRREACLNSAINTVSISYVDGKKPTSLYSVLDEVFEVSKKFEEYVKGGLKNV